MISWLTRALTALLLQAPYAPAQDGRFPIVFQNLARGDYPDDQVFIYALGMDAAGRWCRFLPDGSMLPVDPADADAPGHILRRGIRYANYAFPLSQAGSFRSPTHVRGGRIYISLGAPLCFPIGANAWGGPDLLNPADPNADLIFDFYEYTYVHGSVAFGGNTTQVDQFGFPMTARLRQDAIAYDKTSGIVVSREEVFSRFQSTVSAAFRPLAGTFRILAPRSSPIFKAGGAGASHLQAAIDSAWAHYMAQAFVLKRLGVTFSGGVEGGRLRFTRSPAGVDGAGPFHLDKPTTSDVFACDGALAREGMRTTELELGAEVCAAFNRGVAMNPSAWRDSSGYYAGTAVNEFSMVFHRVGLGGLAYGFPYDDVNDQSSVLILPNAHPPTSLTLTIAPVKQPVALRPSAPRVRAEAHGRWLSRFTIDGRQWRPRRADRK